MNSKLYMDQVSQLILDLEDKMIFLGFVKPCFYKELKWDFNDHQKKMRLHVLDKCKWRILYEAPFFFREQSISSLSTIYDLAQQAADVSLVKVSELEHAQIMLNLKYD